MFSIDLSLEENFNINYDLGVNYYKKKYIEKAKECFEIAEECLAELAISDCKESINKKKRAKVKEYLGDIYLAYNWKRDAYLKYSQASSENSYDFRVALKKIYSGDDSFLGKILSGLIEVIVILTMIIAKKIGVKILEYYVNNKRKK